MSHSTRLATRSATAAAIALLALALAACGSSSPATTAPSQAVVPSVAPSVGASVAPSVVVTTPAPSAPPASGGTAVDPTADLKIGAPYTLTALPAAMQQVFETQMAGGLAAFGDSIKLGFRQVSGGTGTNILMVLGFPQGALNEAAYQAALGGMGASLAGTTFTTTTVSGVDVSTAKASTGGIGVFHDGDRMIMIIASSEAELIPVATALIGGN
jgi:hypothetical protein